MRGRHLVGDAELDLGHDAEIVCRADAAFQKDTVVTVERLVGRCRSRGGVKRRARLRHVLADDVKRGLHRLVRRDVEGRAVDKAAFELAELGDVQRGVLEREILRRGADRQMIVGVEGVEECALEKRIVVPFSQVNLDAAADEAIAVPVHKRHPVAHDILPLQPLLRQRQRVRLVG